MAHEYVAVGRDRGAAEAAVVVAAARAHDAGLVTPASATNGSSAKKVRSTNGSASMSGASQPPLAGLAW